MENMTKEELKRARDILTMPASNEIEAIAIAADFLNACNKENYEISSAKQEKTGLYSVDVSFDEKENPENNYIYKLSK